SDRDFPPDKRREGGAQRLGRQPAQVDELDVGQGEAYVPGLGPVERAPCPLAEPRFAAISFRLSDVVFANLAVVDPAELRPAFAEYVGQTIPIATVCEIRDRAATILRQRGWLAAVQVPPQQIGPDGVVRFDVLMARLTRIQVRGDAGSSERLLASYLEPLTRAPAFNQRDAERHLLLARELPGYDVRLTLRPAGTAPGEVVGDIRVERAPIELEGNVQNYGSTSAGRFGGQARIQFNDILGLGDRTSIAAFSTIDVDEQQVINIAHDLRIGGGGLRIGGEFTYAWNAPDLGIPAPFDSETLIASLRASYPFRLDQATRITGSWGFELIDQRVTFADIPISEDNLRVAFARVDAAFSDRASIEGVGGFSATEPRWRLAVGAEVRQGLDVLGASDSGLHGPLDVPQSRVFGESDATVFRLDATAEFRPVPSIVFAFQPRLQLTDDALLAYEEFSGGNYTVGRGYDPGYILGDQGAGFRSEFRVGSLVPRERGGFAIQPYSFFDAAWVWNEDNDELAGDDPDDIQSVGGGARAAWGDRALLDVALAAPLSRTRFQSETPDVRVLVSLSVRFLP
ncbi:MAG: ShlB/FhaC/HecB family hemolysin secretion/activation protein, partial [Sphingomonadaceae bacterium]|nr:ShlB/FhaC/HecB family hemolysin secretion/activation protein [Sphingomonadaceae bacterium]